MKEKVNSVSGSGEYVDAARFGISPEAVSQIRKIARRHNVSRLLLFGSRARGDFKRTSDIDLAVEGGDFAAFALDVEEETSTLLEFDFVDLNSTVQAELLEEIYRDGKLIYEKI